MFVANYRCIHFAVHTPIFFPFDAPLITPALCASNVYFKPARQARISCLTAGFRIDDRRLSSSLLCSLSGLIFSFTNPLASHSNVQILLFRSSVCCRCSERHQAYHSGCPFFDAGKCLLISLIQVQRNAFRCLSHASM